MEKIILLITQARTGSSRLPNKVLLKINGNELLNIHLQRLKKSTVITKIVVATTLNKSDDVIEEKCMDWGFSVSRGSEDDVLDRYYQALKLNPADYVVRVTSDCPLIDPALLNDIVNYTIESGLDYCSNTLIEQFPDGQDIEVFKSKCLENAWQDATLKSDREHVTPYIKRNSSFLGGEIFKSGNYDCTGNFNHIRMTVDEARDFDLIKTLIDELGPDKTWIEYTNYIINNGLDKLNDGIVRNEGYFKSLKNDNK